MIRKTMFAIATVAAIGAAALIPTQASAGGGKGGGMGGGMGGGYHGHGHWGGGYGGVVVIGPSCWRWVRGLGRVSRTTISVVKPVGTDCLVCGNLITMSLTVTLQMEIWV